MSNYEKGFIRTDRGLFQDKGNYGVDPRHRDFSGGARGDGIRDDRAAIADADTFAVANGCGLRLGPGTYCVNSNLTISGGLTLTDGAILKPASGVTITVLGNFTDPGLVRCVDVSEGGGARVLFGSGAAPYVRPEWFYDGGGDWAPAFTAAFGASGSSCVVQLSPRAYTIESGLTTVRVGTTIRGGSGRHTQEVTPEIRYTGTSDDSAVMLTVGNAHHAPTIEGVFFNANDLAGICLQIVDNGLGGNTATHSPLLSMCSFKGYRKRGTVVGKDTDEAAPSSSDMQMAIAIFDGCKWVGTVTDAIGCLINAGNAEFSHFRSCTFEGMPGTEHKHHIFAYRGGFVVDTCIMTRASSWGINAYQRFSVYNLNTEDRYPILLNAVGLTGPMNLSNINHRHGSSVAGDEAIYLRATGYPILLNNVRCKAKIRLGGGVEVVGSGIRSDLNAGDYWVRASGTTIYLTEGFGRARTENLVAQSLTDSTDTALALGTEDYDDATIYNAASSTTRLVAPQAGKYRFDFYVVFASNATGVRRVRLRVNGSTFPVGALEQVAPLSGTTTVVNLSATLELAAADYVEVMGYQTSGGALNVSALAAVMALQGS